MSLKSLVICSNAQESDSISSIHAIELLGRSLSYGYVKEELPSFYPDTSHSNHVLIEKIGFSCNYRDRSLIHMAVEMLGREQGAAFCPFGSDFIARVVNTGQGVTKFEHGERVIGDNAYPKVIPGSHAGVSTNEASLYYQIIHESKLLGIPDTISDEMAAAFSIGAQTAFSMLRKLRMTPEDNVLITAGTSNTSLFVLKALCALGHKNVDVITSSDQFTQQLRELGANNVIYAGNGYNIDHLNKEYTAVIDPFSTSYIAQVIPRIKMGGKYITCGLSIGESVLQARQLFSDMIVKNVTVIGNCLGTTEDLCTATNKAASGEFIIPIDTVYRNEASGFLERSFQATDRLGKVVYLYND